MNDFVKKYATNFEQIRDMFLFSCYTSLRFSDIIALSDNNFIEDNNGLVLDVEKQQKTGKKKVLPLFILFNGKPEKIIRPHLVVKSKIFIEETNQHINRVLKTVAMLCNIDKNLSFHVARHTFGTLLSEITGDPYIVKDLMSHADIRTSMDYIYENQELKNEALTKFNWDK